MLTDTHTQRELEREKHIAHTQREIERESTQPHTGHTKRHENLHTNRHHVQVVEVIPGVLSEIVLCVEDLQVAHQKLMRVLDLEVEAALLQDVRLLLHQYLLRIPILLQKGNQRG